ncbi:hypothetical protein D7V77_09040 [Corallococcus sp. CA041A]|uniref:hypothetical protein n=1 Tax=Corallococcus sp. CA041A TaxID=2316727 RepID=UPI000EA3A177|nr:hypothetical protein [Corallococcus sp. CA041A]RKH28339.1 hypothetical protein D7V77_09040 [Corallococcus sp. CA041A]
MPDADGVVPPEVDAKEKMDRARACIRAGEVEEAIPLCDEVYRRFTLSKVPALQVQVARALGHRGAAIAEKGMFHEALVHFDEVERRFWSPRKPELWEGVAWGMLYRARGNRPANDVSASLKASLGRARRAPRVPMG